MSRATSIAKDESNGVIAFEPRARLIRLIGGELVSDEIVAVTELVKNAYDADASRVTVTFRNVLEEGGEIVVSDDGVGMDLEALRNYWMQPGGTTKLASRDRRSRKGRRMLGEKGIGRFAVDKLGTALELTSRRRRQATELHVEFDWGAFDHDTRMLSDVASPWELRTPATHTRGNGTTLRISGLRSRWTEKLFRKLCSRLSRLKSPFREHDDFSIVIESEDFPDYSGELSVDFLDHAPYRMDAQFDGDQLITVAPTKGRTRQMNWNGAGSLECGPVRVRLFAFDLETRAIARIGPNREVRAWLKEWTGISVYRDGFRVWPYGEPHDDWLRLDHRRVNNPMIRLSNNQVIGFVEIERDGNPDLTDQTNREGLIHNRPYADLRRLVHFVMQQLESDRQRQRRPAERKEGGRPANLLQQEGVASEIEEFARHLAGKKAIAARSLAKRVRQNGERDQRRYQALATGYAELAAAGQAAGGFAENARQIIERLENDMAELGGLVSGKGVKGAATRMRGIKARMSDLSGQLDVLTPLDSRHSVRRRAVDLGQIIGEVRDSFAKNLATLKISMDVKVPRAPLRAEMRPESFHRVMHILISNSIDWLGGRRTREIRVTARARDRECVIMVSDTGPGIPKAMADEVFEPMCTGREGARGMGLTIARNIVEAAAGKVRVVVDGRRKGAHIEIVLPRKGGRAVRRPRP